MEDIYKVILEEALAGYWDCYFQEDKVMYSPAFKALFGYQDNELPNNIATWINLILPEDRPKMDKCLREHYDSHGEKAFNIDVRYKHKNGSIIWVNSTGRVIEWEGNTPIRMVGCHIDITGKKNAEHELEVQEETFRNAFEYSPIGMVLVSTDGRFLKVNKSICDMLGYSAAELTQKTFQEITHPDDLQADIELVQKTLRKEISAYKMEKRYITKSGKALWILLHVALVFSGNGEPLYFVSQVKDITERRLAESALRESERRWIFASEGTGGGIWDYDLRNNTIFHSKACLAMIGLEEHEFSNVPGEWTKRVHPDDREAYIKEVRCYISGESETYSNQHRVLCKDGSYKWILDRAKVIEYKNDGKPARIIGTHIDITEQKLQEQQLQKTLDIVSGQNSRLLNFAYIVSHNLRTHSSNFNMIMDIVTDPSTSEQEKQELYNHLKKVSDQLNDTIINLNEVVSIQTNIGIQTAQINLRSYVERSVELLTNEIKTLGVEVDNRIAADYVLSYNPAYMESIILNLLSNAIKYRSLTQRPHVIIDHLADSSGRNGFIIIDNGIGIDLKKHGSQLFGMYKTFNGNRDARGMGLFITKNQVEALGGKIEVESELGKGTTFKVYLN
ncbi:PAS domain S-box protein [Mucilaginibacter litoreus]|uniref:histidine kinase n=1 Tax=Mucilaginibacter litoreus TaxID=1048221 RepID=A0ABW3AYJ8_9SPHI